jgi:hypothetical protein
MSSMAPNSAGRRTRATATVALLTATVVVLALGADHALARTVSCGEIITKSTRVDNDLINCPGDGLVIGADDITLDLNGHTIDGDGSSEFGLDAGVQNGDPDSGTAGHGGVRIRNGVIRRRLREPPGRPSSRLEPAPAGRSSERHGRPNQHPDRGA